MEQLGTRCAHQFFETINVLGLLEIQVQVPQKWS